MGYTLPASPTQPSSLGRRLINQPSRTPINKKMWRKQRLGSSSSSRGESPRLFAIWMTIMRRLKKKMKSIIRSLERAPSDRTCPKWAMLCVCNKVRRRGEMERGNSSKESKNVKTSRSSRDCMTKHRTSIPDWMRSLMERPSLNTTMKLTTGQTSRLLSQLVIQIMRPSRFLKKVVPQGKIHRRSNKVLNTTSLKGKGL